MTVQSAAASPFNAEGDTQPLPLSQPDAELGSTPPGVRIDVKESKARYEIYMGVMDGIFEPRAKKALGPKGGGQPGKAVRALPQKRVFLTVAKTFNFSDEKGSWPDAILVRLNYPEDMDVLAESILLAAVKLAGDTVKGANLDEMQAMSLMSPEFDAVESPTITFETTTRALMIEAGMNGSGADYKIFVRQLERLSEITMHYSNEVTKWRGSDFLFKYKFNTVTGKMVVSLNWKLSGAILGRYMYSTIDLNERRQLGSDAAKSLHRWLSAHRWEGKEGFYRYDTLAGHIWTSEASSEAMKKRMQRLKKEVLPSIGNLDKWDIKLEKEGVRIRRLKAHNK